MDKGQIDMITDSLTGGMKEQNEIRFDLIPIEALWEVARLYGIGAKKYTRYGDCSCATNVATGASMHGDAAVLVTTNGLRPIIPDTSLGREQTADSGTSPILNESKATASVIGAFRELVSPRLHENTDSPSSSTSRLSAVLAASAELQKSLATSTMIISRGALEAPSATVVILESDSLKTDPQHGLVLHFAGCPALTKIASGENNWRQGYAWSNSYAALQRHATRFWNGESIDEGGFHHLAAVAFHALALLTFEREHPELDDRFKKEATDA